MIRALLILLALLVSAPALTTPACAHEIRPALLQITETAPATYAVSWRAPTRYGEPLGVIPVFPADCAAEARTLRRDATATLDSFTLLCERPLTGRTLAFEGLRSLPTDVLATYTPLATKRENATPITLRASAAAPSLALPARATALGTLRHYAGLGFEHILEGLDHLAFVLALLLLIGLERPGALLKAVTSFTLAHSLTLAAVSLGFAGLPSRPVEILIALSIALLAAEVLRGSDTLTSRRPWFAAFGFGLLHGFGFAGALGEIGLPAGQVPAALLAFNLGIEAGQLLFVAAASLILWALSLANLRRPASQTAAYIVGALAMSWTLGRLIGL